MGPGESNLIRIAVTSRRGQNKISPKEAITISNTRFTVGIPCATCYMRTIHWARPSHKCVSTVHPDNLWIKSKILHQLCGHSPMSFCGGMCVVFKGKLFVAWIY